MSQAHQILLKEYKRQEYMIFGEAIFFILSLVIGIYLINRAYYKEVGSNEQQKNFLLSITHELKSPLASLRLILETFIKRDLKAEQQRELSVSGLKETQRLEDLVQNLLLAAKVEHAYKPFKEIIDLKQLSNEIINQQKIKHPDVIFEVNIAPSISDIKGDRNGLSSVLINLIENGIKYSKDQKLIKIEIKENAGEILLSIADQGIGIPEKERIKVFEKFYRIGSEDRRKTKGTGLGLFIINKVIAGHQGKIEINNNKPSGTIFNISLPIKA
jgi:signal transduction histidine kinase